MGKPRPPQRGVAFCSYVPARAGPGVLGVRGLGCRLGKVQDGEAGTCERGWLPGWEPASGFPCQHQHRARDASGPRASEGGGGVQRAGSASGGAGGWQERGSGTRGQGLPGCIFSSSKNPNLSTAWQPLDCILSGTLESRGSPGPAGWRRSLKLRLPAVTCHSARPSKLSSLEPPACVLFPPRPLALGGPELTCLGP